MDLILNCSLALSHPDVFVGMNEKKAREQMRNTLFEMAGTYIRLRNCEKCQQKQKK